MIEPEEVVAETRKERKLRQTREWRAKHPERVRAYQIKRRLTHPTEGTEGMRRWRLKHPERASTWNKDYAQRKAARIAAYQKEYRQRKKETLTAAARERRQLRYHSDTWFRIRENLRNRINEAITEQGWTKRSRTGVLIGCTWEHLRAHLESQFQPGMGWSNYGAWHVDHRTPCKAFRLEDVEEQQRCMNWRNLQPLWAADNLRKSAKLLAA